MRTTLTCLATCLAFLLLASPVLAGTIVNNADARGSFRHNSFALSAPVPFDFLLDVNGQEYRVQSEARGRVAVDVSTGAARLIRFRHRADETLTGFADYGRFKVNVYPLTRFSTGLQLYTATYRWTGDGIGPNFGFEPYINSLYGRRLTDTADDPFDWTEPLIVSSITKTGEDLWELDGVTGPRWEGDITLFDRIVGGRQFVVKLREFGFGNWGTLAAGIPEPSTWLLVAIAAVVALPAKLPFGLPRGRAMLRYHVPAPQSLPHLPL